MYGFARARCDDCGHERLIAFSCKGRGICPSCNTRRMAALAAHLTDHVLPHLPVRQWVLSLPKRLRPALHHNPDVAGAVLQIFLRAIRTTLRSASPDAPPDAQLGAVSFLHRFGSSLNPQFSELRFASFGGLADDVPDALRASASGPLGSTSTSSSSTASSRSPPQGDFLLDQTAAFDPADPEPAPDFSFDQSLPPGPPELATLLTATPLPTVPFGSSGPLDFLSLSGDAWRAASPRCPAWTTNSTWPITPSLTSAVPPITTAPADRSTTFTMTVNVAWMGRRSRSTTVINVSSVVPTGRLCVLRCPQSARVRLPPPPPEPVRPYTQTGSATG